MAWMRAVCGRLKSDYRYSKEIVYNTFPWPKPTEEQRIKIEQTAQVILNAREQYSDCSLADMYGEKMYLFPELVKAHQDKGTTVLSVQEQYLANDNISEIIGGHFKVLGKVIFICKEDTENIDLLRKTSLSILQEDLLNEMFAEFKTEDMKQFNLPELKTKIEGPAAIVIPIAIYA